MPNTPDDRLTLLERSQANLTQAQQLHYDTLAQHAVWHKEHRERMAKLDENHQVLLEMLAAQEQTQTQQRQLLGQHAERMARLEVLLQAIKELLERGHNGH